MLPSWLYSTYRQYKADTEFVATWLAETAKACGFASSLFDEPSTPKVKKGKGKGKGNYKKALRDAERRATNARRHRIIPTKDFIPIAEHIASFGDPPVSIPLAFVQRAKRAIKARYRSSAYYNTLESLHEDSGDGHLHFIHVLEGVLAALNSRLPPDTSLNDIRAEVISSETGTAEPALVLAKTFAGLSVDDTPEEAPPQISTSEDEDHDDSIPKTTYSPEPMKERAAFDFAAYCLFADINQILEYVKNLWKTYDEGEIELVAASVTANTAIDMIRKLEEDFMKEFPKTKDAEEVIQWSYVARCLRNKKNPEMTTGPNVSGQSFNFNLDCYEEAEYHLLPTYLLLEGFSRVAEPGSTPISKPGHWGRYDASSNRESKTSLERFEEDRIVLLEALPDFCFLARIKQNVPAEDELTRGLRSMVDNKRIPLWLIFAAQCYLEAHHALRGNVSKPFKHLRSRGLQIKDSVHQNLDFHSALKSPNWPMGNDKTMIAATVDLVDNWLIIDPIHASMVKILRSRAPDPNAISPPFNLLKQHPLLCGLFEFALDLQLQDASVKLLNAWGSVMCTAHLYNAVVQESACKANWPAMSELVSIHSEEKIFVGEHPTNAEGYLKHYLLCMGQSVSALSENSRNKGLKSSKKGPRTLAPDSPVSQIFRRRYTENTGQLDLNLEQVEELLNDRFESTTNEDEFIEKDGMKMGVLSIQQRETRKKLSRKLKQSQRLSLLELLVALQGSISIELSELEFDYLAFHRSCWQLLRDVQGRLHTQLLRYIEPGYLPNESQLPFVVGYIFAVGYQSSNLAKTLLKLRDDAPTTSRLLQEAGTVVEEFLVQHGREGSQTRQSFADSDGEDNEGVMLADHLGNDADNGDAVPLPNIPGVRSMQDVLNLARANGLGNFEMTDLGRAEEAARLRRQ